jgi:hypothetical protein
MVLDTKYTNPKSIQVKFELLCNYSTSVISIIPSMQTKKYTKRDRIAIIVKADSLRGLSKS